jgi:hypothetical protein
MSVSDNTFDGIPDIQSPILSEVLQMLRKNHDILFVKAWLRKQDSSTLLPEALLLCYSIIQMYTCLTSNESITSNIISKIIYSAEQRDSDTLNVIPAPTKIKRARSN